MTDLSLRQRFGLFLAVHRKRHGMTQSQLAEAAGISLQMVAKLETGVTAPRFRTIEALAAALGIDPAELFTSDLPGGTHRNKALNDFTAHFARFSAQELAWAKNLIEAALQSKT